MRTLCLASFVFLTACARDRNPAPEDLDGLSGWLFQYWEDEAELTEGFENLVPWLDGDARTEEANDGFTLSDLTEVQTADVTHPDGADFEMLIGVAVPYVSPWSIEDHAGLLVMEDQTWNDTGTYAKYVREVAEGDAGTFVTGQGMVRTVNDIDKSGAFGVNIPYILYKDYRWVTVADGRRGVIGRSWTEEVSCAEGGNNCLHLSFSIDLFFESGDAETLRTTASWNDLRTEADAFLTEEQRIGLMVNGMNDIFTNTDDFLAGDE
jgi:hypothetical protein